MQKQKKSSKKRKYQVNPLHFSPNDFYKLRVSQAIATLKPYLKYGKALKRVKQLFPVYDCDQGEQLFHSVWNGRAVDMRLTEILEILVQQHATTVK